MPAIDLKFAIFGALATLTLGSASIVAFHRSIIYSTLALLGTFGGVAGMYIMLSADFLAAVQILVYVGGTLTLILFAVMLTARIEVISTSNRSRGMLAAGGVVALMLALLGKVATSTPWPAQDRPQVPATAHLGHAFLSEYMFPFELGSIVLLGAMIGAVILARRAVKRDWEEH